MTRDTASLTWSYASGAAILIRSWNINDWIDAPLRVGAKIAKLIGARADEVVVCDSTSVNLFKLVFAALATQPDRKVVLSEPGNFPTDLYVLQGTIRSAGRDLELRLEPAERLLAAIDEQTALVVLTHVHYKTAAMMTCARSRSARMSAGRWCSGT